MLDPRHISPLQALFGQLLLFAIMVGLTMISLDLSIGFSIIVFIIAMAIISVANYLTIFHPRVSLEDQKKAAFLKTYLNFVINDYEQHYDVDYDVRANIMVPYKILSFGTKRRVIPFVSYDDHLKIWSWAGGGEGTGIESHEGGLTDETRIKWRIKSPP